MGILVVLVVLLAQILSATQTLWRNSEARTDAFRDARAALELMSRELAVTQTNDKAPVLSLSNIYTQSGDATAGPANNQQIYAIVPIKNTQKSDLCCIGFYCSWDMTKHAYVLRRHYLASDDAFARMQAAGLPGVNPAPGLIYSPSGSDPAASPAQDEDVASYVWNLKIVPYETNPTAGGPPVANTTYPLTYRGSLPQYIDITFNALSPQVGRQLTSQITNPSAWFLTSGAIYVSQIAPHTQVFSTRVHLQNAIKP